MLFHFQVNRQWISEKAGASQWQQSDQRESDFMSLPVGEFDTAGKNQSNTIFYSSHH
jgi:hypothetical protein